MTKRVSFIELSLKKCQLDYGVAPCTAEIGVTGSEKCFNCRATCQDKPNIDEADEVVRFAKPSTNIRFDLDATPNVYVPNIASIDYAPEELDLGKTIGKRGSLSVKFQDHASPDTDASGDSYPSTRTYDPFKQGTYWGKFRARHPFIRGQKFVWVQGTSEQLVENMERRHFVVEATAGPDSTGRYMITAKDVLKLTQGDRAVCPVVSNGHLAGALAAGATVTNLTPVGIGNAEYPASGKAAIGGKEIVSFTRAGDVFTIVRAQNNTDDVDHDEQDRFQLCVEYTSQKVTAIMDDLLTTYADIDPAFIPLADWTDESDNFLNRVYSGVIAQPTPVNNLLNELIEQTGSTLYWDSLASLIRWSVLKKPDEAAFVYDETKYLIDSYNVADQLGKRASQVWVFYGQLNPLLKLDEWRNYSASLANIEPESEADFNGVPAYREIYSRWILGDARDTASTLADLILQRYATPPRKIGFRLLRDSMDFLPVLAAAYNFENRFLQDANGLGETMPFQVTSVKPGESVIEVKGEEVTFVQIETQNPDLINLTPNNSNSNYNIYDAYFAQVGAAPGATTVVNVTVSEGVIIGSASTSLAAMTTGTGWPAGAEINIINRGFIVGRGGNGGGGGGVHYFDGATSAGDDGGDGGNALELLADASVDNLDGVIGGGGGGGGGNGSAIIATRPPGLFQIQAEVEGSGGSGGAGSVSGSGGASGPLTTTTDFDGDRLYRFNPVRVTGTGGLAGSLESGGQDSTPTSNSITLDSYTASASTTPIAGTGAGGDLGQDGGDGVDGVTSFVNGTNVFDETTTGGDGGDGGDAIVQNGFTANIINVGDIRGSIV